MQVGTVKVSLKSKKTSAFFHVLGGHRIIEIEFPVSLHAFLFYLQLLSELSQIRGTIYSVSKLVSVKIDEIFVRYESKKIIPPGGLLNMYSKQSAIVNPSCYIE